MCAYDKLKKAFTIISKSNKLLIKVWNLLFILRIYIWIKCRSKTKINYKLLNDKKRIKIVLKDFYARLCAKITRFSTSKLRRRLLQKDIYNNNINIKNCLSSLNDLTNKIIFKLIINALYVKIKIINFTTLSFLFYNKFAKIELFIESRIYL